MAELSIHKYRDKILKAIEDNRILVISGRTGCGKSTQVPQYILAQYPNANIAICQPRRLAATSLAHRVSEELKSPIGDKVGYHIGMEPKISSNTKIVYMTYGILIQQLLFTDKIQYTHILLDEVHERSLEMDFTFIALKKILDSQKKKGTKVIIMSATINSQQFTKHFSTHLETKQFLKPIITYKQKDAQQKISRRGRQRELNKLQLNVQITFSRERYKEAECIELMDKSNYKVVEYFADEIKNNSIVPEYVTNEDVRIRDDTYKLAQRLIEEHLKKNANGDILIFVPGMLQIKTLKDLLIINAKVNPEQIVQVHSAYSDQLYEKLFKSKIKQKIIIATNIGESSITLPFCKTVIDFCLTRKNITVKIKGYSRFETRVASKANLMQRAGRVGRISDGQVYRLIPRSLYDKLDDFDIPQIQCVSLDMAILRAKQIDKTYNSNLFEDPYQVFFNAIEPPKFEQIHTAIEYLIEEGALNLESEEAKNKKQTSKFTGKDLKITKLGHFMVTMPCSIRISKMVLLSLEVGIAPTMIDVAAILLTQKSFFVHEEKRDNIEQFMHSMVGYDRGDYNDFLLRQRMFSHWRQLFFITFLKKNSPYKQKNRYELSYIEKALQQFNGEAITRPQWNWCNDRGISPWVMRDILRISQNIRQRLHKAEMNVQRSKEQVRNQLVILCLCIAFEDTTCQIQWKLKNVYRNMSEVYNYVSIIESEVTTEKNIDEFMNPLPPPELIYQEGGFIRIKSTCAGLSKLLLPKHYSKANIRNTSPLYRYLASNPPKASYTYESAMIRQRVREVTVLNDSINKVNIRPNHYEDYMLVSDKIFDSKGKYYMGACALIQKKKLILIKMMTAKDVKLVPHVSYEFYERVIINQEDMEIPFYLSDEDIEVIKQFRKFSQEDKSKKIQQGKFIDISKRLKFERLLSEMKLKPKIQQWCYVYNETVEKYKLFGEKPVDISQTRQLKKVSPGNSYFERYKKWKEQEHKNLYFTFREFSIKKGSIICSKCWPEHLTLIEDLQAFCTVKKKLKLNEYRGSWISEKNYLCCSRKHRIGKIDNQDEGDIEYQNILMYSPLRQTAKFDGQKDSIKEMLERVDQGIYELEHQKSKIYEFECKICSTYDDYDKLKRSIFTKETDSNTFWKKISEHMYSKKHLQNLQKFLITI